ncbi:MAG: VTT domain-containing protein [Candidatus Pacebacteria bacterium]|nr:VTT domain-containing protein [Candidatus Paceibacterota bacterium]
MESSYEQLHSLFLGLPELFRYLLVFAFAFGEGLPIIGSFLPGGTVSLLIGGLSEDGFINPWLAVHIIAIGSLIGDLIGFFAGQKLLHFKKVRDFVYAEKQQSKWDLFDRHAALVIIFGKIIPVIRSTPALFAGARKMHLGEYIFFVLIGSYLWAIGGIWGGKYLAQYFGSSFIIILVVIIILSIAISIYSHFKNK